MCGNRLSTQQYLVLHRNQDHPRMVHRPLRCHGYRMVQHHHSNNPSFLQIGNHYTLLHTDKINRWSKRKMISFHVKFVQTDRLTDNGKTICPALSMQGHKKRKCWIKHFHFILHCVQGLRSQGFQNTEQCGKRVK